MFLKQKELKKLHFNESKKFAQNDYNKLEQQSIVKIKYNNTKMRIKSTSTFIESRKRTLRSSNKSSRQDFVVTASSSEQKVIQEIQKIFDNQQSINLSKSTDPLHQDHKLPLIPAYQNQQFVTKEKVCPITQSKNEKIDCNLEIEKRQQNNDQPSANVFGKVLEDIQNASIDERDIFQTPVKFHKENGKNENSNQLNQYRRSYRKLKRSNITQIPYRKFQDPFQQKIVILINRILHNKITQKDVINFTDKIIKMSSKDIYNPYIVSGIKTVLNLIEKSSILPPNCINKLKSQFKKLSIKILTELEKTQDYSSLQVQKKETDYDLFKPKFIKKIYKFLIQTNQYEFNEAKQKSVELCQQFFSQSNNFTKEDELLSFFKEQIYLQD